TDDAYILGQKVPSPPAVDGDSTICANLPVTYTTEDNGSIYKFVVDGNGVITDSTDNSITVVWSNNGSSHVNGSIEIFETVENQINGGCTSLPTTIPVTIYSLPTAAFSIGQLDTLLPGGIFVHDVLEVTNNSLNSEAWSWDFGDGTTSTDQEPYHSYYEVGAYNVRLAAIDSLECTDTTSVTVNVVEGLIIPSVFTPNNDGWNDAFDIRTSGIEEFNLQIYNRWGNLVYENKSPLISWDGTTNAGVQVPEGTYYYLITKAALSSGAEIVDNGENIDYQGKDWHKGWVQLLR
ncbi:gliding motility-associated C-terminal domain-containing protein, partial [Bacteroidota bacterium]